MFITRKEFEREKEIRKLQDKEQWDYLKKLTHQINSLAKELGYEWTSEAVKINDDIGMTATEIEYRKKHCISEKAVLKYSWKKIDKPSGTPYTSTEVLMQQAYSNKASWEKALHEWVIPYIKKQLDNKKKIPKNK